MRRYRDGVHAEGSGMVMGPGVRADRRRGAPACATVASSVGVGEGM